MQKLNKYLNTKQFKTAKPLVYRLAVFLLLFVITSGIFGPQIISHGLVGKYGFQIYGGAGKGLLFAGLVFLILLWRKKQTPKLHNWVYTQLIWLICSLVTMYLSWELLNKLISGNTDIFNVLLVHLGLLTTVAFLLLASFGLKNILKIYKFYKRELYISILLGVFYVGFLYFIYGLWTFLCSIVLNSVKELLGIVGIFSRYIPPRTLSFNGFSIVIAEYCSGIESIALFTALYAFVGVLDWQRFNHKKYFVLLLPALVVLFGINILRVFVLILGGYYINPQLAFSLFHTYASMIFFIIFSGIFWAIVYNWILIKNDYIPNYAIKNDR